MYKKLAFIVAAPALTLCLLFGVFPSILEAVKDKHKVELFLTSTVTDKSVTPLLYKFHTAKEYERITLYINSPGGYVDAGLELTTAMCHSKAKEIETVVIGEASSMAGIIALNADKTVMKPGTFLMVHLGSIGDNILSLDDLKGENGKYVGLISKLLQVKYNKYLTVSDWEKVNTGRLAWITDETFNKVYKEGASTRCTGVDIAAEIQKTNHDRT
jgi:hypothetical protein